MCVRVFDIREETKKGGVRIGGKERQASKKIDKKCEKKLRVPINLFAIWPQKVNDFIKILMAT
jgi:hypothetical protein